MTNTITAHATYFSGKNNYRVTIKNVGQFNGTWIVELNTVYAVEDMLKEYGISLEDANVTYRYHQ